MKLEKNPPFNTPKTLSIYMALNTISFFIFLLEVQSWTENGNLLCYEQYSMVVALGEHRLFIHNDPIRFLIGSVVFMKVHALKTKPRGPER